MASNSTNYSLIKPEILDTFTSTIPQLYDNFEDIDSLIKQLSDKSYKWNEEHVVTTGNTTITLVNTVVAGDFLQITNKEWGIPWFAPDHWTVSGNTITFNSAMVEDLTFEVVCCGARGLVP